MTPGQHFQYLMLYRRIFSSRCSIWFAFYELDAIGFAPILFGCVRDVIAEYRERFIYFEPFYGCCQPTFLNKQPKDIAEASNH